MKKYIALLLSLVMIFAMAACGAAPKDTENKNEDAANTSEPANNESAENKEENSPSDNREGPATISIDETDAQDINNSEYSTYADYSGEFAATIKITTDTSVKNFRFVELECTDISDSGEATYEIGNTLFSLDTFSKDTPVVISFSAPEILPTRAVEYTDTNGNLVLLGIFMSGEDGHFFFEEILNTHI